MKHFNNDVVIINQTLAHKPDESKYVRDLVIKQIREDGVAMVPVGFTAIIAKRSFIIEVCDDQIH